MSTTYPQPKLSPVRSLKDGAATLSFDQSPRLESLRRALELQDYAQRALWSRRYQVSTEPASSSNS